MLAEDGERFDVLIGIYEKFNVFLSTFVISERIELLFFYMTD